MPRKGTSYADAKARARRKFEDWLDDNARLAGSAPLTKVKQTFHHFGLDMFAAAILRDMAGEGLIKVWTEGDQGVIYLEEGWANYMKGRA